MPKKTTTPKQPITAKVVPKPITDYFSSQASTFTPPASLNLLEVTPTTDRKTTPTPDRKMTPCEFSQHMLLAQLTGQTNHSSSSEGSDSTGSSDSSSDSSNSEKITVTDPDASPSNFKPSSKFAKAATVTGETAISANNNINNNKKRKQQDDNSADESETAKTTDTDNDEENENEWSKDAYVRSFLAMPKAGTVRAMINLRKEKKSKCSELQRMSGLDANHENRICPHCGQKGLECFDALFGTYLVLHSIQLFTLDMNRFFPSRHYMESYFTKAFQHSLRFYCCLVTTCLDRNFSWRIAVPDCVKNGSLAFVLEMFDDLSRIRMLMEEIRPCVISTVRGLGAHRFLEGGEDGRTAVVEEQEEMEEMEEEAILNAPDE